MNRYAPTVKDQFYLYDGTLLPFPQNWFDACYSWFVFEHVACPQTALYEIMRTLKPGGTLSLHAENTRNGWDGHVKTAWPPYMPREFSPYYLAGLGVTGRDDFFTHQVKYISTGIICEILDTLGAEIVYRSTNPPRSRFPFISNEEDAFALGRKIQNEDHPAPSEHIRIFARKPELE